MACTVAPSKLSKKLPASPLSSATNGSDANDRGNRCKPQKTRPSEKAPSAEAVVPSSVIPPEVPGETRFPDVIKRGSCLLSTPNSVAQVSALAVANAPVKPACNNFARDDEPDRP